MALHRIQQHLDLVDGSRGPCRARGRRVDRDDGHDFIRVERYTVVGAIGDDARLADDGVPVLAL